MASARAISSGRVVWLALLIVAAALLLLATRVVAVDGSSPRSRSAAAQLLAAIERQAGLPVTVQRSVEHSGPDGPMPEIAARAITVAAPESAVLDSLSRACAAIGLAPADPQQRAAQPDMLCQGRWRDRQVSVHAALRCADQSPARCELDLETQLLPF